MKSLVPFMGLIILGNIFTTSIEGHTVDEAIRIRRSVLGINGEKESDLPSASNISDRREDDLKGSYKTINNYLIDSLRVDDPEINMQFANEWFEQNLTKTIGSDRKLVEAVGNLTELGKIGNGSMCNKTSLKILEVNDNGTEGRTRMLYCKQYVFRRIDKLVSYHMKKYTNSCQTYHSTSLKKKYGHLNRLTVERVENLTDSFIKKELQIFDGKDLTDAMYKRYIQEPRIGMWDGSFLRRRIISLAKDDPDRVYLNSIIDEREGTKNVNMPKVIELYRKYLVKPCEYFVYELKDIFDLADFDNRLWHNVDLNDHDYYLIWSRYHLCESVVTNSSSYLHTLLFMAIKNDS